MVKKKPIKTGLPKKKKKAGPALGKKLDSTGQLFSNVLHRGNLDVLCRPQGTPASYFYVYS